MDPIMNTDTRQLLNRWQSLKEDGGLQRAASTARTLWFVGLWEDVCPEFPLVKRPR